jgi:hypothetical protein
VTTVVTELTHTVQRSKRVMGRRMPRA